MSKIDRKALVNRHNIVISKPNNRSPLTVGNGKFGFTADVTGLQSFSQFYKDEQPLCTLSEWGYHTNPRPGYLIRSEYKYRMYKTGDREVPYATGFDDQSALYGYLREGVNHRAHLGMVGFNFGDDVTIEDIKDIHQELDMYTGMLTSSYKVNRKKVDVVTCSMFERDAVGVSVKSALLKKGKLSIFAEFPYPSPLNPATDFRVVCDGNYTEVLADEDGFVKLKRTIDADTYYVGLSYTNATIVFGENRLDIMPTSEEFSFVIEFAKEDTLKAGLTFGEVAKSSTDALKNFWEVGGIVDFGAVKDPRAKELENRMIKSMYITRINSCPSHPPYESGFTCNGGWYGKSHTEMHYWHAAHFAQFSRPELLDVSLNSYNVHMDKLEELAKRQGYKGLRLPKMIDAEMNENPSYIAPLLLWEQPHPIMCAELMYRVNKDKSILEKYFKLIEGTVEFMLDFLLYDEKEDRYVLDAPYIPAQEWHEPGVTKNALYELEYWYFAFVTYKKWCERLGKTPLADLDEKLTKLSLPPVIDGMYPAHENCPDTYDNFNLDHPSMLCAYGVLPGERLDADIVAKTLDRVLDCWQWDTTWGWDYALLAMCAAKLDRRDQAVDVLLKDTSKNRYSPNGHVYQYPSLPCYIDTNGALLIAIGFLATGCDSNPGCKFPEDWDVKIEDMVQYV